MLTLVTDPDAFFRDEAEDPDLIVSVVIVLLAGALSGASGLLLVDPMLAAAPGNVPGWMRTFMIVQNGAAVLVTPVLWLVFTGVFYGVTAVFEGEGAFTETLALTGWGYVPSVVSGVVSVAATYQVLREVGQPAAGTGMFEYVQQVNGHELMTVAAVAGLVLVLWQGVIWTFAMKHARDVDRTHAALSVAGPVLLLVLLNLVGLIGFF